MRACELTVLGALGPFDRQGDAVSAAEAQRGNAAFQVAPPQRIEQRRQHARAARADRVPESNSPAVHVHLALIDAKRLEDVLEALNEARRQAREEGK